ncbi:MAG TPA: hypothetical protein PKI11_04245 [Candidatus Hydrogenedentes bacterium]|nr:hypothetical protein [Candidatus Hydrogenedentota bacterium]HNT87798.1 hypothetical protein [Candidatus Hydrogenedentota bacterium]
MSLTPKDLTPEEAAPLSDREVGARVMSSRTFDELKARLSETGHWDESKVPGLERIGRATRELGLPVPAAMSELSKRNALV